MLRCVLPTKPNFLSRFLKPNISRSTETTKASPSCTDRKIWATIQQLARCSSSERHQSASVSGPHASPQNGN